MVLVLIWHPRFQICDTFFQGADISASRLTCEDPNRPLPAPSCIVRTRTCHRDIEVEQPSHMHMQFRPFRMICSRAECHHTSKYTIRTSVIAVSQQCETLTRCLRRLHLLHARFTRDFRGADVDVPGAVPPVDAVRRPSCPCGSGVESGILVIAFEPTDDLA
jgi:hypothetical protein